MDAVSLFEHVETQTNTRQKLKNSKSIFGTTTCILQEWLYMLVGHSELPFRCWVPFCSVLSDNPHSFNKADILKFQHLIRPVATDCQSSSCVIWPPQPFLPVSLPQEWLPDSHTSTETVSDEALVNSGWINWRAKCLSRSCVKSLLDFFPPCFLWKWLKML